MTKLSDFLNIFIRCYLQFIISDHQSNFQIGETNLNVPFVYSREYSSHNSSIAILARKSNRTPCLIQVFDIGTENLAISHLIKFIHKPTEFPDTLILLHNNKTTEDRILISKIISSGSNYKVVFVQVTDQQNVQEISILSPVFKNNEPLIVPLCRNSCDTVTLQYLQKRWNEVQNKLDGSSVSLPADDIVHMILTPEVVRFAITRACSISPISHDQNKGFSSYPGSSCVLLEFILKSNFSISKVKTSHNYQSSIFIDRFKLTEKTYSWISSRLIFPYAESHDGVFYSVFVNRSELVFSLNIMAPFQPTVWWSLTLCVLMMSVILGVISGNGLIYLRTTIFWTFAMFLEQSSVQFEIKMRRFSNLGTLLIGLWSLTMVVVTNTYTDSIYSFLVSDIDPIVPDNFELILKSDTIKTYTFRTSNEYALTLTSVVHLLEELKVLRKVKILEIPYGHGLLDTSVVPLSYRGFVGSTHISKTFVVVQNYADLRAFSVLIKETGRFVKVKNSDENLVKIRVGWVASKNYVGHMFGRVLVGFLESGIYQVWNERWRRYLDIVGLDQVRKAIAIREEKREGGKGTEGDKSLSWGQLRSCFIMLVWGIGLTCIAHSLEIGWYVNLDIYFFKYLDKFCVGSDRNTENYNGLST